MSLPIRAFRSATLLVAALAFAASVGGEASATTPAAPVPAMTDAQRTEWFKDYDEAVARGAKQQAADALLPILADPTKSAGHGDAWIKLGDLLESFDMSYSALIAWRNAIEIDPNIATQHVGKAMDVAEKLGDEALLAPALAKNVGLPVDAATRSRMAYLAARHNLTEGQYGLATGILMMVDKSSPVYPQAEALRGIVLSQQEKYNEALAPLLIARQVGNPEEGARWDNMLTLNVARANYGAGNYAGAIEHFEDVSRESEFWPESVFERAWAHFRLDDMNGALAQLHTLDTPYFEAWYLPEADLLRTYSLFMMCKFPQATKEIDAFAARWSPTRDALTSSIAGTSRQQAWDDVKALDEGKATKLPTEVLQRFAKEDRIHDAFATVAKADDELGRLQAASASPFAAQARDWLTQRRAEIIDIEGQRVLDSAERARAQLADMLNNVDITRLDMMQFETQLYERAAVTGTLEFGDPIGKLRKLRKQRGTRVWPYEGEIWADELGWYVYDARPDCPEGLQAR